MIYIETIERLDRAIEALKEIEGNPDVDAVTQTTALYLRRDLEKLVDKIVNDTLTLFNLRP